jgi:methyl-accepting chemotaxis protein
MAKNESLSSDIELIKEIEELKLKQKLLIETLKKKNSTELTRLFSEVNSKLDFLVKIFKEANENSESEDEIATKLNEIDDKIDKVKSMVEETMRTISLDLEQKLSEKFMNLQKKIEQFLPTVCEAPPVTPVKSSDSKNENLLNDIKKDVKKEEPKKKKWF